MSPGSMAFSRPEGMSAAHIGMLTISTILFTSLASGLPFTTQSIMTPGADSLLYFAFTGTMK